MASTTPYLAFASTSAAAEIASATADIPIGYITSQAPISDVNTATPAANALWLFSHSSPHPHLTFSDTRHRQHSNSSPSKTRLYRIQRLSTPMADLPEITQCNWGQTI